MGTLLSNTNYYSNAIVGIPQQGADIDLYQTTSTPKYQVGFGFQRADGNRYRYCQFANLSNRGSLVAPDIADAGQKGIIKAGATVANLTKQGNEIMNPNDIGSRYAQLTISASANQFAGGYLTIASGTGFGFTYRIRGNDTTSAKVTGDTFLNLYDPIVVKIDSNSDIIVTPSRYTDLTPGNPLTASAMCVSGVTVTNNSASGYGWICTHGVTSVLQDASIAAAGKPVYLSTTTAGAICGYANIQNSNTAVALVGYMIEPASSTEYSVVYLTLE
jgi:hypothetical protein